MGTKRPMSPNSFHFIELVIPIAHLAHHATPPTYPPPTLLAFTIGLDHTPRPTPIS